MCFIYVFLTVLGFKKVMSLPFSSFDLHINITDLKAGDRLLNSAGHLLSGELKLDHGISADEINSSQ